jgi:hypothetical protein
MRAVSTIRSLMAAVALLASACGAPADAPAEPAAPAPSASGPMENAADAAATSVPTAIACGGPFTRDATPATLAAMFGRENVIPETVDGPEGEPLNVTAIYSKDPQRRIEIRFANEEERTGLVSVVVRGDASLWEGPGGIHLGDPVEKVEAANGAPFQLTGFGWDYGGYTSDWRGGKLGEQAGCRSVIRFAPQTDDLDPSVQGDGAKPLSSDPKIRAARAQVTEFGISLTQ